MCDGDPSLCPAIHGTGGCPAEWLLSRIVIVGTGFEKLAENCLTDGNRLVTLIGNRMVSKFSKRQNLVFRAISDPTRREILNILRSDQQTVGNIAHNFRMSRPAISKHLRVLRSAGLVETRRHGTQTRCTLNAKPLQAVNEWLHDYETFWKESLQSLKKHLEEKS